METEELCSIELIKLRAIDSLLNWMAINDKLVLLHLNVTNGIFKEEWWTVAE